jgi:hypothetical protein
MEEIPVEVVEAMEPGEDLGDWGDWRTEPAVETEEKA